MVPLIRQGDPDSSLNEILPFTTGLSSVASREKRLKVKKKTR